MKEKQISDALKIRFDSDAGNNLSIREYLHCLLKTLWEEGEGFSGKRPFGNSSWEFDLYAPLIQHGFISGTLDEDGYVDDLNKKEAETFVSRLIDEALGVRKNDQRKELKSLDKFGMIIHIDGNRSVTGFRTDGGVIFHLDSHGTRTEIALTDEAIDAVWDIANFFKTEDFQRKLDEQNGNRN